VMAIYLAQCTTESFYDGSVESTQSVFFFMGNTMLSSVLHFEAV
jgi:hypothetical protein